MFRLSVLSHACALTSQMLMDQNLSVDSPTSVSVKLF